MKKHYLLLFLCFFLGLFLRNIFLQENLLFGFEQGRDFNIAEQIANFSRFTLIGPKTDIEGIFHGAYYYYLLALFIKIGAGSPFFVAFLFTLLNSLTILVVFFIAKELMPKKFAVVCSFLTGISFSNVIYGRWISNVSPSILIMSLFSLFVIKLIKTKKNVFLPPVFLFLGLTLHFEILNFLNAGFILLFSLFFLLKKNFAFRKKYAILSLLLLFISFLPFLIFNCKHNNILISRIIDYASSSESPTSFSIKNLYFLLIGINREIETALFPFSQKFTLIFYLLILISSVAVKIEKDKKIKESFKLLVVFLSSPAALIFFFKYKPMYQFFSGMNIAIIVLFVFAIWQLTKSVSFCLRKLLFGFFLMYVIFNIPYCVYQLKSKDGVFYHASYKEIAAGRQKEVIEFAMSFNSPYEFDAFTTPLYRPTGWEYLNQYYQKIYKWNPKFKKNKLIILVIEPFTDKFWLEKWLEKYDKKSKTIETKYIKSIFVQVRKAI